MVDKYVGSFCVVRWMVVAALLLLSASEVLLADQPPPKKAEFKGNWIGKYLDNEKNTGDGLYDFREDKDGRLTVLVTWWDKGEQEMTLKGERLGHNAMRMEGEWKGTTFRYIGDMEGSELVLHYKSVNKKTGKSGFGISRLTRPK